MEWFERFVSECVDRWGELNPRDARRASFREWLEDFEATASEVGQFGEDHVAQIVGRGGYAVTTSKGSLTPADVWGGKVLGGAFHVCLLQVKTAVADRPRRLREEEVAALEHLAGFVGSRLGKSVFVPEDVQALPRVISTGYAGVILDPHELRADVESAFPLDVVYSKSVAGSLPELKKTVGGVHRLKG